MVASLSAATLIFKDSFSQFSSATPVNLGGSTDRPDLALLEGTVVSGMKASHRRFRSLHEPGNPVEGFGCSAKLQSEVTCSQRVVVTREVFQEGGRVQLVMEVASPSWRGARSVWLKGHPRGCERVKASTEGPVCTLLLYVVLSRYLDFLVW